ncbi:hypothetical protein [Dactylosporangium sp. CA-233914]|uniref:hypothetical protein n=1 Tax=Dactylosporangium sp. CA-233914 TaxID=3239934 RepID=UPI003D8FCEFB
MRAMLPAGGGHRQSPGIGALPLLAAASDGGKMAEYQPVGGVARYADGTLVTFDAEGNAICKVTPGRWTYSHPDSVGRWTAGTTPDGVDFRIAYRPDGSSITTYEDRTIVEANHAGELIRQTLPDQTVYDKFDPTTGKPVHGTTGDGVDFNIVSNAHGSTTFYEDGTVVSAGLDGETEWMRTPDRTLYDKFDPVTHKPVHGTSGDDVDFGIGYDVHGSTTRYEDGTVVGAGLDGETEWMRTPDRTLFDKFDPVTHKPVHGTTGDDVDFDIFQNAHGSTTRYEDGTVVGAGLDGETEWMRTPDRTLFDKFDPVTHKPVHGTTGDDVDFDIFQNAHGSTTRYEDGTVVGAGVDGETEWMRTPDRTLFDKFDPVTHKPVHGTTGDDVDFSIGYDGHGSTTRYEDGTVVSAGVDGETEWMRTPDRTLFDKFDPVTHKPVHGTTGDDVDFDIFQNAHGSTTRYEDGTVVGAGVDGETEWMRTPDRTLFDKFDPVTHKPVHGTTGDDVDFSIVSNAHGSTTRYEDGTVVGAGVDGETEWMRTPDRTLFDKFDPVTHKPVHGTTGDDVDFSIGYDGHGSTTRYEDGTVVSAGVDGETEWMRTPDRTLFDKFDPVTHKPVHGTTGDDVDFDIFQNAHGSTTRYEDGTVVGAGHNGETEWMRTPDRTLFDKFDPVTHKPVHGTTGDDVDFDIFQNAHGSTTRYEDGTVVGAGVDGETEWMRTPDRTLFDKFDPVTHKPVHGTTGDDVDFSIVSNAHGSTTFYEDGTVVSAGVDGETEWMRTPDRTLFDKFDPVTHKPVHGTTGDDVDFDIFQNAHGSTTRYEDGTVVGAGVDGETEWMRTPDRTLFDKFDPVTHKPVHGTTGDDVDFSIGYDVHGSTTRYEDGTVVGAGHNGETEWMRTPDRTLFDKFDPVTHKPVHGTTGDDVDFSIGYDGHGSTTRYEDGTVVGAGVDGETEWMRTPDRTLFDKFDPVTHKPVHGTTGDDVDFDIFQNAHGSTTRYEDGTVVGAGLDGETEWMRTPDRTLFDKFDPVTHKPVHGTTGDDVDFDIFQNAHRSTTRYEDGTVVGAGLDGETEWMRTPDRTLFDKFDPVTHKPVHGTTGDDVDFSIGYDGHGSTTRYEDGTVVGAGVDGETEWMRTPDRTLYDKFDPVTHKPVHGTTGDDVDFDIFQNAHGSTTRYEDGTVVGAGVDGETEWMRTPDRTLYDKFDPVTHKPVHGTTGDDVDFSIGYDGHGSTTRYEDGTVVSAGVDGETEWMRTPDRTLFDKFDPVTHKPVHGTTGDDVDFSIGYDAHGSTTRYEDGTVVSAGVDGETEWMRTPDRTLYDKFDLVTHKPVHGTTKDDLDFDIVYNAHGSTTFYEDDTVVKAGADGKPAWMRTADHTVYDAFDSVTNKPISGITPDKVEFHTTYRADGSSVTTYQDDTIVEADRFGEPVWMRTRDLTVYDHFDKLRRPTSGVTRDKVEFDTVYGADGSSVTTYVDKTIVKADKAGHPTWMKTSDGTEYDAFDPVTHLPISGKTRLNVRFDTVYEPDGSSTTTYADKTIVKADKAGHPTWMRTPDGTEYGGFDPLTDLPTSGKTRHGLRFDTVYEPDGSSTTTYEDKTIVKADPNGKPTLMVTPDKTVFDAFDSQRRPIRGRTKDHKAVTILHRRDGSSRMTIEKTAVIEYSKGRKLLSITTADGYTWSRFGAKNRPTQLRLPERLGGDTITLTYLGNGDVKYTYGDGRWTIFDEHNHPTKMGKGDEILVDFAVDLPLLAEGTRYVQGRRNQIASLMQQLDTKLVSALWVWDGPAADAYATQLAEIRRAGGQLLEVLDEAIHRMQQTYDSYVRVEVRNGLNLTPV